MTEPVTAATDEDTEIVEWFDGESRHVGSRYGSAYVAFCNRWLSAERTHKAEQSAADQARLEHNSEAIAAISEGRAAEPGVIVETKANAAPAPTPDAQSTTEAATEDSDKDSDTKPPQTSRRRR